MKITKKDVQGMFRKLLKACKKYEGPIMMNDGADGLMHIPGGWSLDYCATYGGYVIEEHLDKGGISHPFGAVRRTTREMYLSMHMLTVMLEEMAREKQVIKRLGW